MGSVRSTLGQTESALFVITTPRRRRAASSSRCILHFYAPIRYHRMQRRCPFLSLPRVPASEFLSAACCLSSWLRLPRQGSEQMPARAIVLRRTCFRLPRCAATAGIIRWLSIACSRNSHGDSPSPTQICMVCLKALIKFRSALPLTHSHLHSTYSGTAALSIASRLSAFDTQEPHSSRNTSTRGAFACGTSTAGPALGAPSRIGPRRPPGTRTGLSRRTPSHRTRRCRCSGKLL